MESYRGQSRLLDAHAAVVEATAGWPERPPSLVLAFVSTKQDSEAVRAMLAAKYPGVPIAGCSTTGEHLDGRHANGTLTLAALYTPKVSWAVERIAPLAGFREDSARAAVDRAMFKLGVDKTQHDPRELIGVLLCDGLSGKEELVAAAVAEALDGAPLVGGSAGDDLAFKATHVFTRDTAGSDAAVLVVGKGPAGFYSVIKHQHFTARATPMAVTRADPAQRKVYEIDGYPAAEAYARAIGVSRAELADASFLNPVLVTVQGEQYVRSVQSVADDGSITFYCAVEEGWILDLAGHHEMTESLRRDLASLRCNGERPAFLLGFHCILRALEAQKRGLHEELGAILSETATASIGFDTYGEVKDGLHINQTLVALALSEAA